MRTPGAEAPALHARHRVVEAEEAPHVVAGVTGAHEAFSQWQGMKSSDGTLRYVIGECDGWSLEMGMVWAERVGSYPTPSIGTGRESR
jgi:hypothetical protein